MTQAQLAYFQLISTVHCNNMNGQEIVNDLFNNPQLWTAVVPDFTAIDDARIGDTETTQENSVMIDTLYIKSSGKHKGKLIYLAHKWQADEFEWIEGMNLVFKVWFD